MPLAFAAVSQYKSRTIVPEAVRGAVVPETVWDDLEENRPWQYLNEKYPA
jgi:hypothetical protein